jgi:hypothetical protein
MGAGPQHACFPLSAVRLAICGHRSLEGQMGVFENSRDPSSEMIELPEF